MRNMFTLGRRVLNQLFRDKWFLIFSLAAPVLIIIVLRVFFDTLPEQMPVEELVVALAATVVFIITFVLCMISVVEERVNGTLERMYVNGVSRPTIIVGYVLGYLVLATVQTAIVIAMILGLFDLSYSISVLVWLFATIWLLALASVALGVLISSFVRRQVQIIPFIPLVLLPTIFLSGIMVDPTQLPLPAQIVGRATPLYYANNAIQEATGGQDLAIIWPQIAALVGVIAIFLFLASRTLKTVE
ncbi:MAG: ABC transporter permease [Candidatus Saccharimonadales bacterium]